MSLKKNYIRDGKNRIIGSVTSGYCETSAVVRDEQSQVMGRTSERFHTVRGRFLILPNRASVLA